MSKSIKHLSDRELLELVYKAQQEDHQKIIKIHNRIKIQFAFNILKWAFYIGIAVALYILSQPFIQSSIEIYQNLKEGVDSINQFRSDLPNFPFLR